MMKSTSPIYINVKGQLLDLSIPQVMGILNVTPDSFYAGSRMQTEEDIAARARQIIEEGAAIIDIGAYSSRPNAEHISAEEEMNRLRTGLEILNRNHPEAIISVDTFRADVAAQCVNEYGVAIINDIAAGEMDDRMAHLEEFRIFELPLLVGVSRKSMIYKLLGGTPQDSLNGTTILDTVALMKGAHILRVHDVREAVEAVRIVEKLKSETDVF